MLKSIKQFEALREERKVERAALDAKKKSKQLKRPAPPDEGQRHVPRLV
jgi:hypothetical protein